MFSFPVSSKGPFGGVAQLVERFGRIEEARGSIPLTSTRIFSSFSRYRMTRLARFILLVLLICGCGNSSEPGIYAGLEVSDPSVMPNPILTDTNGQPFAMKADTEGSVRLVYFGFSSCPDICSVHLAQLSDVIDRPGMPPNITVIFVTVDPDVDTPEVMRSFLDQFNSDFVGLTGTNEELVEAQRQFSALIASPVLDDEGQKETIGHDGRVFAFSPDGIGRTQYPHPTRQTTWTRDLPILASLR